MGTARRGQMSLEFIIGMVILLIVAVVVINLVLNTINTNELPYTRDRATIEQACQQRCLDWQQAGSSAQSEAVEYCTQRFNLDADGDGSLQEVSGSGRNSYCEDGVHCFNVHDCRTDFEELDAAKCREIMCRYYQDTSVVPSAQANPTDAGRRVYRFFEPGVAEGNRGAGTCGLPSLEDATGLEIRTWWSNNFQPDTPGDYATICGPDFAARFTTNASAYGTLAQGNALWLNGTTSTGATSYNWHFDGDSTAEATGPVVEYANTTHTPPWDIRLEISDGSGNSDDTTETVG